MSILRQRVGVLILASPITTVIDPRATGSDPNDVTSFMPGQQWSLNNLPDILYFIIPPRGWTEYKSRTVTVQLDAYGQVVFERWPEPGRQPRPLRSLPALPDQIGTWECPLYILAWRKLEPSCTWDDILMRMSNVQTRPVNGNVLSMRIARMMDDYMIMFTWRGTKDWIHPTTDQQRRMDKLDPEALAKNSTRRFTPGLCYPEKGEAGGRIPIPEEHRRRSRMSYARKVFMPAPPRASRAKASTMGSSAAAKKRKAAVKGPGAKKPRLIVKLPVRVGETATERPDFDDHSDEDTAEDDTNNGDTGEEDVNDSPYSQSDDQELEIPADKETAKPTPEQRVKRTKLPSDPFAHLRGAQATNTFPFARPIDTLYPRQYGTPLNPKTNDPYRMLPWPVPGPAGHYDTRAYDAQRHGRFIAPKPVEPFTFGSNTGGLVNPFQTPLPAPRVETIHSVSHGSFAAGTSFTAGYTPTVPSNDFNLGGSATGYTPTVPSNDFNFGASALNTSRSMGSFPVGYNNFGVHGNNFTLSSNSLPVIDHSVTANNYNVTANEYNFVFNEDILPSIEQDLNNDLLQDDAPYDDATEQDYAYDNYWYHQR